MAYIRASNLVVDFPIYGTGSRSLKKSFIRTATGGTLARDAADHFVVRALDQLNFELKEGARVGLVGHNGSGKTTLLRVLGGMYEPVQGTIEIRGRIASMLGIMLGIEGEASGLENIYLRETLMGLSRREIDQIVDDVAAVAELGDRLEMPVRTYSSGMAMRLAFSVSTCVPADIILMDEWLSVGDEQYAAKAQRRLHDLVSQAKILVLASHEKTLIHSTCNKVIRLEHGRLVGFEPIEA